ncbi:hypothetical protein M422DRAFT_242997 [Sphaerobolus stellatus SS14]|nr:hypothetical protein M422DRAFT_242997 [Sphaerobolus stellatus SS14]
MRSRSPAPPLFYEKRSIPQQSIPNRASGGRSAVVECPHPSLILTNCLIVHPTDFGAGAHVLINKQYPVTTTFVATLDLILTSNCDRHDTTQKLMRGQVGVSSSQRQWIELAIIGDQVTISPLNLPPSEIFLEELDIEIGFWKRTLEIAEQFSSNEIVAKIEMT